VSGRWTHSICDQCWAEKNPGRMPYRVSGAQLEVCCYCGREHESGILVREDPERVACFAKNTGYHARGEE
jgi:hypothetical protein